MMGVTTFGLIWACTAKIEEAIPATGKLEPQEAVREMQVPLNGVVKSVHVKEGQAVKPGDLLLTLDSTTAQAQLSSLQKIRTALVQENQYYRTQLNYAESVSGVGLTRVELKIPTELLSLTKSRAVLVTENQLYRAQLNGAGGSHFTTEQQLRLQTSQAEVAARAEADRLDIAQIEQQFDQTHLKLANAKSVLAMNQKIVTDLGALYQEGGIARLQVMKQQQEVSNRQTEVDQLRKEQERIRLAISQSRERLKQTLAVSTQEILSKISSNEIKIAEIDSQINKAIIENEKKIAEIDSQISQAKQTLHYQELRAPVAGTVFDLKAGVPGFVTNSTEPVLKIVPENALVAKVSITNKDIGFVREGMPVDIRVDSFPFSEFGDIKGELISVGSDALPPTEQVPVYTFPLKIHLEKQSLSTNGRKLLLQSGMSVSVNIKLRERRVISIFMDGLTQQLESLKFAR
jgi:hemolysin D